MYSLKVFSSVCPEMDIICIMHCALNKDELLKLWFLFAWNKILIYLCDNFSNKNIFFQTFT